MKRSYLWPVALVLVAVLVLLSPLNLLVFIAALYVWGFLAKFWVLLAFIAAGIAAYVGGTWWSGGNP